MILIMEFKSVNEIFEFAVGKEKEAVEFYTKLSQTGHPPVP